LGKAKKRPLIWMGSGVLAAAGVITLAGVRMTQEPPWLEKMNEFEHFVLHFALVMGGLIVGSTGLAAVLSSMLWKRNPRDRLHVLARALNKQRTGRLKQSHLIAVALADLAIVTVILAKRHLIEPLWLTSITPFQHFLFHVGLVASGLILGVAGLGVVIRFLFNFVHSFLDPEAPHRVTDNENLLIRLEKTEPWP
jgi:hypothetical protein